MDDFDMDLLSMDYAEQLMLDPITSRMRQAVSEAAARKSLLGMYSASRKALEHMGYSNTCDQCLSKQVKLRQEALQFLESEFDRLGEQFSRESRNGVLDLGASGE